MKKLRTFNISHVQPKHIYRIYKEGNDLVIITVDNRETRYCDLTEEERDTLISQIKQKGREARYNLEVYNGFYEAKNH